MVNYHSTYGYTHFIFTSSAHTKWNLNLNETIELALSNFGGISGGYLIYQSYNLYDSLSKLVGNEGIIAMFLGGLASVWFAFGKVKESIDKP